MPISRSWRSATGEGEPLVRSTARAVFGKAITARSEVWPVSNITRRSRPSAMPPCGGVPYAMASDGAAAEFQSIQNQVISLGTDAFLFRFQYRQVFIGRRGKRVVPRNPSVLVRVEFQQRKIDDPEHFPFALRDPILLARQFEPKSPEPVQDGLLVSGHQKNRVASLRAGLLNHGL